MILCMQRVSHLIWVRRCLDPFFRSCVPPLLGSLPYAITSLDHIILADPRAPHVPCHSYLKVYGSFCKPGWSGSQMQGIPSSLYAPWVVDLHA